jgi:hypothetical protein
VLKVNLKVWFWVILLVEPKVPAASLVTVWGASEVFNHSTCVPTLIVSVAGWKEYFPFCSMIFTLATFGVEVGVGVGAVVGDGVGVGCVVAVGVEAVVVPPPPPHAAKSRATIIAKERYAQSGRVRLANDARLVLVI